MIVKAKVTDDTYNQCGVISCPPPEREPALSPSVSQTLRHHSFLPPSPTGPAGTGKTTTAVIIAHEIYGAAFKFKVLSLNASDDRGISVVRGQIRQFCEDEALEFDDAAGAEARDLPKLVSNVN